MKPNEGSLFQEVDILQVLKKIGSLNKKAQARILQRIEMSMDPHSEEYKELRKFILDELNDLTRGIVRQIFGDIEYLI